MDDIRSITGMVGGDGIGKVRDLKLLCIYSDILPRVNLMTVIQRFLLPSNENQCFAGIC
jgi:hypothetical protein